MMRKPSTGWPSARIKPLLDHVIHGLARVVVGHRKAVQSLPARRRDQRLGLETPSALKYEWQCRSKWYGTGRKGRFQGPKSQTGKRAPR